MSLIVFAPCPHASFSCQVAARAITKRQDLAVAVMYDTSCRREWAQRAYNTPDSFDINQVAALIDESIVATVVLDFDMRQNSSQTQKGVLDLFALLSVRSR